MMRTTVQQEPGKGYIGANILTLASTNKHLLPDRMDARRAGEDIVFYIDGRAVSRFGQDLLFDIVMLEPEPAEYHRLEAGLDRHVSLWQSAETAKLVLHRDWEDVLEVSLDREVHSMRIVEQVETGTEVGDLETAHNILRQVIGGGFESIGNIQLIDRITHVSGSTDPRLIAMISNMDQQIEDGIVERKLSEIAIRESEACKARERMAAARQREETEAEIIAGVVNDFFEP